MEEDSVVNKHSSNKFSEEMDEILSDKFNKDINENLNDSDDEFVDNYSHMDESVFYTTHNILGPGIDEKEFYAQIDRRCHCVRRNEEIDNQKSNRVDNYGESNKRISTVNEEKSPNGTIVESDDGPKDNDDNEKSTKLLVPNHFPVNANENQQEVCTINCPCDPNQNYSSGHLNVDQYKLPIYECNDYCNCRSIGVTGSVIENSSKTRKTKSLSNCSNSLTQKGPHKDINIFNSEILVKGFGVRATRGIRKGEFICEYAGEVISKMEAKRRYNYYREELLSKLLDKRKDEKANSNFYIFHLNEIAANLKHAGHFDLKDQKTPKENFTNDVKEATMTAINDIADTDRKSQTTVNEMAEENSDKIFETLRDSPSAGGFEMFVDATRFGNIARYINHSCDPNCTVVPVRVNSIFPKLAIFAKEDIVEGEELAYDYGGMDDIVKEESVDKEDVDRLEGVDNDALDLKPCLCGSDKCRKFLPYLPLQ